MNDLETLWQSEKSLWTMGAAEAARHMDDSVVTILGPGGILQGQAVIDAIAQTSRWDWAELTGQHSSQQDGVVVLAYHARASRDGQEYAALCSSTWVRHGSGWRLLSHQHTPI